MKRMIAPLAASLAALAFASPLAAEDSEKLLTPNDVIAAAPATDWKAIAPDDLLVMTLAPDAQGHARQVVIQLMPPPFSQGWVENIRTLANAHWYDGIAIVRVQDNYVVQWGDPDGEDAEKAKPLPPGLRVMGEDEYSVPITSIRTREMQPEGNIRRRADAYADWTDFYSGWPIASDGKRDWPIHCYSYVGVGRNYSPDTGTGAELYAVIGQAPRQLDRNIAVVGRVIEGIENLSSLPRGTGGLSFYTDPAQRVPILSIRLASDLPAAEQPHFKYLDTGSASFAEYLKIRANRHDAFYFQPAGGVDICNAPVPVRRVKG